MTKPEIVSLSSGYSGSMGMEGSYDYTIAKDNDGYHLHAILNSGNDEIEKKLTKHRFETLVGLFDGVDFALLKDIDLCKGESALDAASFNFTAQFSDGNMCSISSKAAASGELLKAVKAYECLAGKIIKKRRCLQWLKRT